MEESLRRAPAMHTDDKRLWIAAGMKGHGVPSTSEEDGSHYPRKPRHKQGNWGETMRHVAFDQQVSRGEGLVRTTWQWLDTGTRWAEPGCISY